MTLPIWIAGGAVLAISIALFWCVLLAWMLSEPGRGWNARWAWRAHYLLMAWGASLSLLALVGWVELRPW